jgi:hypothetical protein
MMRKLLTIIALWMFCLPTMVNVQAAVAEIGNPSFEDDSGWVFSHTGNYWSYDFTENWSTKGARSLTLYVPGSIGSLYPGANTYAQVAEQVDLTGVKEILFDLQTYGTWNDPAASADTYHSFEILVDGNVVYTLGRETGTFTGQRAPVVDYDGAHTLTLRMRGHADYQSIENRGLYLDNLRIARTTTALPVVFGKVNPCQRVVALTSPANGSQLATLIPTLTWINPVVTLETDLILEMDSDSNFSNPATTYASISAGSQSSSVNINLLPATTYYWRIRYTCENGTLSAPYSQTWSFTTGSAGVILPAPSLISPGNNSTVSGSTVTLKWKPVTGAISYIVWIDGVGGKKACRTTTTAQTIYRLYKSSTYTWQVVAQNSYALGSPSVLSTFFTNSSATGVIASCKPGITIDPK